jgi:predicted DNA-binding transcriptional regulator YafY
MSRTERLLDLMQVLRRHRYPITGQDLARELDISLRTLYRDIATLQSQGAKIEGEPGLGYVLRPGFTLPPLMFSEEEIEAIVLGSRWVAERGGDERLSLAAKDALAKIASVLPPELRLELDTSGLLIPPSWEPPTENSAILADIRQAIRSERKLIITYQDVKDDRSQRTIWPCALAFFDKVRVVVGWCELREGFRHFRTDRIHALEVAEVRYPKRRQVLLKEWRVSMNYDPR